MRELDIPRATILEPLYYHAEVNGSVEFLDPKNSQSKETLEAVYMAVVQVAESAGINPEAALVSGFRYGVDPDEVDHQKLQLAKVQRPLANPSLGSDILPGDSSVHGIALRKIVIGKQKLIRAARQKNHAAHAKASKKIETARRRLQRPDVPVYYFMPLEYLADESIENNPLRYLGEDVGGSLGLYDQDSMRAEKLPFGAKSEQIRVAAFGKKILQHQVMTLHLNESVEPYVPDEY